MIEKICLKLQLPDKLAWNEEKRGRIEEKSMNAFGKLLCFRACTYHNAFSIAANQVNQTLSVCPNRPINDAKPGNIKVQQRLEVNQNKSLFDPPGSHSVLSERKSTDCPIVTILNYSRLGSLSVCIVVFLLVASPPNIQFTNVTDEDSANNLLVDIFITCCYTMPTRNSR